MFEKKYIQSFWANIFLIQCLEMVQGYFLPPLNTELLDARLAVDFNKIFFFVDLSLYPIEKKVS